MFKSEAHTIATGLWQLYGLLIWTLDSQFQHTTKFVHLAGN